VLHYIDTSKQVNTNVVYKLFLLCFIDGCNGLWSVLGGLKGTIVTLTLKHSQAFSSCLKRRQCARSVPKDTWVQESCQVSLCNSHANLKGLG